jgi:hypothetical protein
MAPFRHISIMLANSIAVYIPNQYSHPRPLRYTFSSTKLPLLVQGPRSRRPQLIDIRNLLHARLAFQSGIHSPVPSLDDQVAGGTNESNNGCLDDQRSALAVCPVGDLQPLLDLPEVVASIAGDGICGGVSELSRL